MSDPRGRPITVLFTSAGRRVELLRAFRAAFRGLGVSGRIIATDVNPLSPALREADQTIRVPRTGDPAFVDAIETAIVRERVHLVFPLIDPDIPILSAARERLERTGALVLVPDPDAVRIVRDKWLTAELFSRLGLATPRMWLPGELDAASAEYPLFIKPRDGSAAKDAFKVRDARELDFFSGYVANALIQEFLPGPEITTDVVCDRQARFLGLTSRQRIEVRGGEVSKGVTVYHPLIAAGCVRIAEALPAAGPITVQCMMKDGVPHFTEINARFGGGVPLGIAAGVDGPALLVALALGLPMAEPELGRYQVGLTMARFDDSFFYPNGSHA